MQSIVPYSLDMARRTKLFSAGIAASCLFSVMSLTALQLYAVTPPTRNINLEEIQTGECVPNPAQAQTEVTCTFPVADAVNNLVTSDNILIGIRDQNSDVFYEGKRCTIQEIQGFTMVCKLNLGFRVEDLRNFSSFQWTPDSYQHDIVLIDDRTYTESSNKALMNVKNNFSPFSSWKSDYGPRTNLVSSLTEVNDTIYQTFVDMNGKIRVRSLVPNNLIVNTDTNPYDVTWNTISNTPSPAEFTSLAVNMAVLNGRFYQVHVGRAGRIFTRSSTDAKNWSQWFKSDNPNERTNHSVHQAVLNGNLYQNHIGTNGKIYTRSSADGINWTSWSRNLQNPGEFTNTAVTMITRGDSLFQTHVGTNKRIFIRSSKDGVNWSRWNLSSSNDTTDLPVSLAVNKNSGRIYRSRVGLDSKVYIQFSDDAGTSWTIWREYGGTSDTPSSIYIHNGILLQLITSKDGYIFWRF